MSPKEQLSELNKATHELVGQQYGVYKTLLSKLLQEGLRVIERHEDLTEDSAGGYHHKREN